MRRRSHRLMTLTAISIVGMTAACGATGDSGVQRYSLLTAQTGGYFYLWGAAAAQVINENVDGVEVTAEVSGGSNANLDLLNSGEAQLGLLVNDTAYKAYNGLEGPAASELRTIFTTGGSFILHIVVPEDSTVESLSDLQNAKVAFGAPGSGHYTTTDAVLTALGMSFEDFNATNLSLNEMTDAFKDGTIDAFLATGDPPQPPIVDAATAPRGVKLIPLSAEEIKTVIEAAPYLAEAAIPAGAYDGVDEDINSVTVPGGSLVTTSDFPDDLARQFAEALGEHHDDLVALLPKAEDGTAEATVERAVTPLSEGAAEYFESIGLDLSGLPGASD